MNVLLEVDCHCKSTRTGFPLRDRYKYKSVSTKPMQIRPADICVNSATSHHLGLGLLTLFRYELETKSKNRKNLQLFNSMLGWMLHAFLHSITNCKSAATCLTEITMYVVFQRLMKCAWSHECGNEHCGLKNGALAVAALQ